MKIVLSPNPYLEKGLQAAREACRILEGAGCQTAFTLPFGGEDRPSVPGDLTFLPAQEAFRGADILICFGGDGTILHAAKEALAHGNIPVLGVNLGSMGFMAELETGELPLLERLPKGDYRIEKRMLLDVWVRREGRVIHRDTALNDAVVTKGAMARVIDLDVLADGIWENFFETKPEPLSREEKKEWLKQLTGVALGSDAFFPFGDNIERAHRSGVTCIAQPGGSIRDDNVIEVCNRYGIAMACTGIRLFHH